MSPGKVDSTIDSDLINASIEHSALRIRSTNDDDDRIVHESK